MAALRSLGIHITIWTTPVEVPDRTPFEQAKRHKSYDPEYAAAILAHLGTGRPCAFRVSFSVHWQSEPGTFFLGGF